MYHTKSNTWLTNIVHALRVFNQVIEGPQVRRINFLTNPQVHVHYLVNTHTQIEIAISNIFSTSVKNT